MSSRPSCLLFLLSRNPPVHDPRLSLWIKHSAYSCPQDRSHTVHYQAKSWIGFFSKRLFVFNHPLNVVIRRMVGYILLIFRFYETHSWIVPATILGNMNGLSLCKQGIGLWWCMGPSSGQETSQRLSQDQSSCFHGPVLPEIIFCTTILSEISHVKFLKTQDEFLLVSFLFFNLKLPWLY